MMKLPTTTIIKVALMAMVWSAAAAAAAAAAEDGAVKVRYSSFLLLRCTLVLDRYARYSNSTRLVSSRLVSSRSTQYLLYMFHFILLSLTSCFVRHRMDCVVLVLIRHSEMAVSPKGMSIEFFP
jgi:hypothetical protein